MDSKRTLWAGRVVSVLAALPFAMAGTMKFVMGAKMASGMAQMGVPMPLLPVIGSLELLCVIVYAIPRTAVLGAILFTGFIGGAIMTHLRIGQAPILQTALGVLVWLGLWLREPRLRELLPLRN
jgi:DoxX-like family